MNSNFSILSWNVRGSITEDKALMVRKLVRRHNPCILGLQETKREQFHMRVAKYFWGNRTFKSTFIPATGASGGLAMIWDPDRVEVTSILKGRFSVSLLCVIKQKNITCICSNVYGPSKHEEKSLFWEEIRNIKAHWVEP